MIKIPCNVSGCNTVFDSTLELKMHNFDNHYNYFLEKSKGNNVILKRNVGVLKK